MKTPLAATLVTGMLFGLFSTAPLCAQSTLIYEAFLSGPAESPPNGSPGTGFAEVIVHTGFGGQDDNMILKSLLAVCWEPPPLRTFTPRRLRPAPEPPGWPPPRRILRVFRWG